MTELQWPNGIYIPQLGKEQGTLEEYAYYGSRTKPIKTKTNVIKAIGMGIPVKRREKKTGKWEKFDFGEYRFV